MNHLLSRLFRILALLLIAWAELVISARAQSGFSVGTPANQHTIVGGSAVFRTTVTGFATVQWNKNNVPIAGATKDTLTLTNVQSADSGSYSVTARTGTNSLTSRAATLTVTLPNQGPVFVTQPSDVSLPYQGYLNLAAIVVSSADSAPVTWECLIAGRKVTSFPPNSSEFGSEITAYVAFGPLDIATSGTFQIVATNRYGSTTSAARNFTIVPSAPVIVTSPGPLTVTVGSRVEIPLTVRGTLTDIDYKWYRNNQFFSRTDTPSLVFPSIQLSDAGSYHVVVANTVGSTLSAPFTLTVVSATAPGIDRAPINQTVAVGGTAVFVVGATGTPPFTYQWTKDGKPIPAATSDSLVLYNLTQGDAGSYAVSITNTVASVTSSAGVLTITATAPTILTSPPSQTFFAGTAPTLTVSATGTQPLRYQWYKGAVAIPGATFPSVTLPPLTVSDTGSYTVKVENIAGSVESPAAQLTVITLNPARLINLSLLTALEAGEDLRLGFVANGSMPVLARAAGPTLATAFGLAGAHPDPKIELFSGSTQVGENDNWFDDPYRGLKFGELGAFPFSALDSKDAALYAPAVSAGSNSVRVAGASPAGGVVLTEIYAGAVFEPTSLTPRLINVSVLKRLGSGLTVGFVVGGDGTKKILARAVGPTLISTFGLAGAVSDPALTLVSASGATLATNDNWDAADEATMLSVGAFALVPKSRDAALVTTLQPGAYSLQVRANGGDTGTVLVELYEVP